MLGTYCSYIVQVVFKRRVFFKKVHVIITSLLLHFPSYFLSIPKEIILEIKYEIFNATTFYMS